MVRLIQHHLERAGYRMIQARNRQEAIQAIAQQAPELVVLDESEPARSSLPASENISTKRIRAHSRHSHDRYTAGSGKRSRWFRSGFDQALQPNPTRRGSETFGSRK